MKGLNVILIVLSLMIVACQCACSITEPEVDSTNFILNDFSYEIPGDIETQPLKIINLIDNTVVYLSMDEFRNVQIDQRVLPVMGDVNNDGTVDQLDVVDTVDYILGRDPDPFYTSSADLTHDGIIDVRDILRILHLILGPPGSISLE